LPKSAAAPKKPKNSHPNFSKLYLTSNWNSKVLPFLSGTDKGVYKTGKKFKVRGVSIITVKNGKISRSLDYYDAATIMKQVGLLPAS
jgi:predicted ester cyclase